MANDSRNRFEIEESRQRKFFSKNFKEGVIRPLAGGILFEATATPRDPKQYQPLRVRANSLTRLADILVQTVEGFRFDRTEKSDFQKELDAIRAEVAEQRKAANAPPPPPERTMFGLPESSPEAHAIAQRELEQWLQIHKAETDFVYSEFNARNLLRRLNEERERGDWDSPTVEHIEAAYRALVASGCWERKWRKRGEPAACPYYPQPVAPKPTQEQIEERQRAAELEERRRLRSIPFEELQKLYESQKGRTRKAAFSVNR